MRIISIKDYSKNTSSFKNYGFIPFPKSNTATENKIFASIETALLISYDASNKEREAGMKFINFFNNN